SSLLHERIWHPSQTLVEQEDGSVILSFQISDFREMQPWIRSWGSEVEVLAPSRLRSMIKEDIYKMAALYQQDNNHA
nr:WYL domain-containing protein [Anaerolineae bacterium]